MVDGHAHLSAFFNLFLVRQKEMSVFPMEEVLFFSTASLRNLVFKLSGNFSSSGETQSSGS